MLSHHKISNETHIAPITEKTIIDSHSNKPSGQGDARKSEFPIGGTAHEHRAVAEFIEA